MLEARRLIKYSDKSISAIACQIGFIDLQSFSHFFNKHELKSTIVFRESSLWRKGD